MHWDSPGPGTAAAAAGCRNGAAQLVPPLQGCSQQAKAWRPCESHPACATLLTPACVTCVHGVAGLVLLALGQPWAWHRRCGRWLLQLLLGCSQQRVAGSTHTASGGQQVAANRQRAPCGKQLAMGNRYQVAVALQAHQCQPLVSVFCITSIVSPHSFTRFVVAVPCESGARVSVHGCVCRCQTWWDNPRVRGGNKNRCVEASTRRKNMAPQKNTATGLATCNPPQSICLHWMPSALASMFTAEGTGPSPVH